MLADAMTPSATESERIRTLLSYDILDSLPEPDYDQLTRLAAQLCQTPIGLITLLDEHRQWFKARHGLDLQQTPRELSFCRFSFTQPHQPLVVGDARQDERFASNALVTGYPYIVFYAGVPLVDEQGFVLGALCVIDHQPRQLTNDQLGALASLARQVVNLLALRLANKRLLLVQALEQRRSADLEQQVAERTEQLAQANATLQTLNSELQRSNTDLQEFAVMASHDLQEPLRKIEQFGKLLQEHYGQSLGESGQDLLGRMQGAAMRMAALIRDLLDYARLNRQEHPFRLLDLDQVVSGVLTALEVVIAERRAVIEVGPLGHIRGDAGRLAQVFQNLISNALKFAKPGLAPFIRIQSESLSKDQLPEDFRGRAGSLHYCAIRVADAGIGFASAHAERIFGAFQRLHGKNEYPGTGIGLAIVKRVIDQHGGYIRAESEPEQGATFTLYLPTTAPTE